MKKSTTTDSVGFHLKAIEILEFSMNNPSDPLPDTFTYHTNLSIEHRIIEQQHIIMVVPTARIFHEDKKITLAEIKVNFIYEFNSFEGFMTGKPGVYNLSQELIVTLNSISISTVRGIMFALFRGTFLHKAILPVIDPKTLKLDEIPKS